jgi:hypothetical protein
MYYTVERDALAEAAELMGWLVSEPTAAERWNGCC